MSLLGINYHYIHDEGLYPYPAIYPTTPADFEAQLISLSQFFHFVSGADLLTAQEGRKELPENACIITFDDGLDCQYSNALPILDKLGIPAILFVSMKPILTGKALNVHKIHMVRANYSPANLISSFQLFCRNENIEYQSTKDLERASAMYLYDEADSALLKYYLNYKLEPITRERFVDSMYHELIPDEAHWCKKTYLKPEQLKDLHARGYLGSHTYSHLPLGMLGPTEIEKEITLNKQALAEITAGNSIPFIAYPYGSAEAVTHQVAEISSQHGYRIGFSMERALNNSLNHPLLLARLDTNDVLKGKKPLMHIENEQLRLLPGLSPGRNRYFIEEQQPNPTWRKAPIQL